APGFLVTVVAFTLAIVRYKLFIIVPVEESALTRLRKEEAEAEVAPATSHLVEEKTPDAAYGVFLEQIASGSKGLLITRTHPDAVKERHGLVETPIIWLASTPGPDRVDPSNLSILQHTVAEFLRKDENTVIMLDGIEYLISNNPMEKVLRTMYAIRDEVVVANSRLIVPLDPEVLDESKLALLEREFEITRAGEGAGTEI
ncbi:MAG: DUF835 domain-containing protein, partial [Euryarchaeota archaeon]|nr:DUF835 domain-containing protein [Euryarchaeota archaeon]